MKPVSPTRSTSAGGVAGVCAVGLDTASATTPNTNTNDRRGMAAPSAIGTLAYPMPGQGGSAGADDDSGSVREPVHTRTYELIRQRATPERGDDITAEAGLDRECLPNHHHCL